MTGRLEWPDPTPDGPTPEEEARMDLERECQRCDGWGIVEVFRCPAACVCGHCPDLEDCPECVGKDEIETEMENLRYGKLPPL